ncbi:hypothetical protein Pcinc_003718 [Petrolisthes cinctipes]|uniref:Uncharacterized protein n=1 Tax=Petrolisthes cinctipes TaxID=88211 RepID=A0AAE1GIL2_PETCI|nr:hypothetical protein Pcinc_003718 [Petrolisthes cinctipes]
MGKELPDNTKRKSNRAQTYGEQNSTGSHTANSYGATPPEDAHHVFLNDAEEILWISVGIQDWSEVELEFAARLMLRSTTTTTWNVDKLRATTTTWNVDKLRATTTTWNVDKLRATTITWNVDKCHRINHHHGSIYIVGIAIAKVYEYGR